MSFERPSLQTLIQRIEADIESRLPVTQLRRSNAKVYARVMAAVSHALHAHVDFIARQLFFDTAESEYLDRWASLFGLRRKPATKAIGTVAFSFASTPVDIPVGTIIQSETGIRYETTSPVRDGVANCSALLSGTEANLLSGEVMTLVSPIAGVKSSAQCRGVSGGSDREADEELRTRLFIRVRNPPHGGTESDYVSWALGVEGVTRAWCYPLEGGLGHVAVRFVCDGMPDILPTKEMIEKVQAHIDALRPVTAIVSVSSPSTLPVAFTIANLLPENETIKARVKEELVDLFAREGAPGGRIYLSHIRAAISAALGEEDHTLVAPTEDVVAKTGVLPTVGEITWQ